LTGNQLSVLGSQRVQFLLATLRMCRCADTSAPRNQMRENALFTGGRSFITARHFDERMVFVPEGQHDRSQARSAWKSVPPKEPSRRVRYDRARLIHEVCLVEMRAVFLKENSQFSYSKFSYSNQRTAARPFGVVLSQALRARLRSHRPSGRFGTGFS
jgi:hypothetical protein